MQQQKNESLPQDFVCWLANTNRVTFRLRFEMAKSKVFINLWKFTQAISSAFHVMWLWSFSTRQKYKKWSFVQRYH